MQHTTGVVTEPGEYLSRSQVAELFNVAPSTVTRWADEGRLTCVRTLGGHRRYLRESVVRLVRAVTKEGERVETISLEIPRMYGDHHTIAVRQILAQLDGIQEVSASAARRQVRITFDPQVIDAARIAARLAEAGYPTHDGNGAAATPPHHKDPAWAELGLRMTQTHRAGA
jgi:excisionase family DNA binding protein